MEDLPLPEIEVRVLRDIDESTIDDYDNVFLLRDEEIEAQLELLVRDAKVSENALKGLTEVLKTIRSKHEQTIEDQLSSDVLRHYGDADRIEIDEDTKGLIEVDATIPYYGEQKIRTENAVGYIFTSDNSYTAKASREFVTQRAPVTTIRVPPGSTFQYYGYAVGPNIYAPETYVPNDLDTDKVPEELKDAFLGEKIAFVPYSLRDGIYPPIGLIKDIMEQNEATLTEALEMLGIQFINAKIYRELAKLTYTDFFKAKKPKKTRRSGILPEPRPLKIANRLGSKFLRHETELDRPAAYAGPTEIVKYHEIPRIKLEAIEPEWVTDVAEFLDQYAVIGEGGEPEDEELRGDPLPDELCVRNINVRGLQLDTWNALQFVANILQIDLSISQLAPIFTHVFERTEWKDEVQFLSGKLPEIPPEKIPVLQKNARLIMDEKIKGVLDDFKRDRDRILQACIAEVAALWAVEIHIEILESLGNSPAFDGNWSLYGFPFKKKDKKEKGLVDRVAEILNSAGKLPILLSSPGEQFRDAWEKSSYKKADITGLAESLKKARDKNKEAISEVISQLVVAFKAYKLKLGRTEAGVAARELCRVLKILPAILVSEKVETVTYPGCSVQKIDEAWSAFKDFDSLRALSQIKIIMKTLSDVPGATEAVRPGIASFGKTSNAAKNDAGEAKKRTKAGSAAPNPLDTVAKAVFVPPVAVPTAQNIQSETEALLKGTTSTANASELMAFFKGATWDSVVRLVRKLPLLVHMSVSDTVRRDAIKNLIRPWKEAVEGLLGTSGSIIGADNHVRSSVSYGIASIFNQMMKAGLPRDEMAGVIKRVLQHIETAQEWSKDIAQEKLARLREKEKSETLEYLDKLSDEDKAIVRDLKQRGIESYKDLIQKAKRLGEFEEPDNDEGEGGNVEVIGHDEDEAD